MAEKKIERMSKEKVAEEIRVISDDVNFSDAQNKPFNFSELVKNTNNQFLKAVYGSDLNPASLKAKSDAMSELDSLDHPLAKEVVSRERQVIINGNYINKLKKEEIAKWFEPFGYVSHKRHDGFADVRCKDFEVVFNNYELVLEESDMLDPMVLANSVNNEDELLELFDKLSNMNFNFDKFSETCEEMDMTPAQVLEEYVAIKLSERFPSSYPAERKKYKDSRTKKALNNFKTSGADEKLVDLMSEIKDRQFNMHEITHNRGHYGTYKPDET